MTVLLFAGAAVALASPVSNYRCDTNVQIKQANVTEVNNAYMRHSIRVIDAALKGDLKSLGRLVASDAQFTVFDGDVGLGPRTSGPDAAAKFFTDLAPTNYQLLTAGAGPFSMDPCGAVTSDVLLLKAGSDESFKLTFSYENGILVKVTGSVTSVINGSLNTELAHG